MSTRRAEVAGRWRGETVVCIASGNSLTEDDCELVRARDLRTIVVNTTFRRAPWADALYAMDRAWWQAYGKELDGTFHGERFTNRPVINRCRARALSGTGFRPSNNSGAGAISLAAFMGARRILLLGFDLQHTDGKAHWHGDHPKGLGNAKIGSIKRWRPGFVVVRAMLDKQGIEYLNCSRETALDWPRCPLEEALDARLAEPTQPH